MPCGHAAVPVQAWTSVTSPISPRPKDLTGNPRRVVRISLVAHLRCDVVLLLCLCEEPRFPRRPGEGFLQIDVFTHLHARQGASGVHVVRWTNYDRINVLGGFVEHLAEILVSRGLGKRREPLLSALPIAIRECDHILVP